MPDSLAKCRYSLSCTSESASSLRQKTYTQSEQHTTEAQRGSPFTFDRSRAVHVAGRIVSLLQLVAVDDDKRHFSSFPPRGAQQVVRQRC